VLSRPALLAGGTVAWYEYASRYQNFEPSDGGTAVFQLQDAAGATLGTALWTADYGRGVVTFASNTAGSAYYVTGRVYDLNAAAADIWRTKAAQAAKRFDFSTDNHSVSRSQVMQHALQMADYYESLGAATVVTLRRDDLYDCDPWPVGGAPWMR
jgi:hypothetical protein